MPTVVIPNSSSATFSDFADIIDFLAVDGTTTAFNSTSFSGSGTYNGQPATFAATGTGFVATTDANGTYISAGTLQTITMHVNGSLLITFTNMNIDMAVFAPIILADIDGSNPAGIENFMQALDWDFTLNNTDNIVPSGTVIGDGVTFNPTGNDSITSGTGDDHLFTGGGNDTIRGGAGNDTLEGGDGNDTLDGGADTDRADYRAATGGVNASLLAGSGTDGSGGTDTYIDIENLTGSGFGDTLIGDGGNNALVGKAGADSIDGGLGDDYVEGGSGNDTLDGGGGTRDVLAYSGEDGTFAIDVNLTAGTATDTFGNFDTVSNFEDVRGTDLNDSIVGDGADNRFTGSDGNDTMRGEVGDDTLDGGAGNDRLYGRADRDLLLGGDGDDRLFGGSARDTLRGDNDDDDLFGSKGRDRLEGGDGNDSLEGEGGHDNLLGNAGNDTLNGGAGNDRLTGGKNADTFVFEGSFGDDTIIDFSATNNNEDIDLSGVAAITDYADLLANHIDDSSGTVIIDDGAGNTITLTGITSIGQLDAGDFLF